MEQQVFSEDNVSSKNKENKIKKNKSKVLKTKEFWTCRMYNYYTLKFFKSKGILIYFFVLVLLYFFYTMFFNPILAYYSGPPNDYNKDSYFNYSSELVQFISVFSVLFSLAISSLIIKDEIRNKTMLIFASLPMSRKRMFTEQLLSFFTIDVIVMFIFTFILPTTYLFYGSKTSELLVLIYSNAIVTFFKLLFINLAISIIMLFFVIVFNERIIKVISPLIAIFSLILLIIPTLIGMSSGWNGLLFGTGSSYSYTYYDYFAVNSSKYKLNKLDNKYLDITSWIESNGYFNDSELNFNPDNPLYSWNNNYNNLKISLIKNGNLDNFISELKTSVPTINFNDFLSYLKIDNNNMLKNSRLPSSLSQSLLSLKQYENDEKSFSFNSNTITNSDLYYNTLKKTNNSLANVYQSVYKNNKLNINKGLPITNSDLGKIMLPYSASNTVRNNLNKYLLKNNANNKPIYLNDYLLNYLFLPTKLIAMYSSLQIFIPDNYNSTPKDFGKIYKQYKKAFLNNKLLLILDPFLQFHNLIVYNQFNNLTSQAGIGQKQGVHNFTFSLETRTISYFDKNSKKTINQKIMYANIKQIRETLPMWSIYLIWTLISIFFIGILYLIYSKKDFK